MSRRQEQIDEEDALFIQAMTENFEGGPVVVPTAEQMAAAEEAAREVESGESLQDGGSRSRNLRLRGNTVTGTISNYTLSGVDSDGTANIQMVDGPPAISRPPQSRQQEDIIVTPRRRAVHERHVAFQEDIDPSVDLMFEQAEALINEDSDDNKVVILVPGKAPMLMTKSEAKEFKRKMDGVEDTGLAQDGKPLVYLSRAGSSISGGAGIAWGASMRPDFERKLHPAEKIIVDALAVTYPGRSEVKFRDDRYPCEACVCLYFPEAEVGTDSSNQKHKIYEVYVNILLSAHYNSNNIEKGFYTGFGNVVVSRSAFTRQELTAGYSFSHVQSMDIRSPNGGGFTRGACLGRDVISVSAADISTTGTIPISPGSLEDLKDKIENYFMLFESYIRHESSAGGPYMHISNIPSATTRKTSIPPLNPASLSASFIRRIIRRISVSDPFISIRYNGCIPEVVLDYTHPKFHEIVISETGNDSGYEVRIDEETGGCYQVQSSRNGDNGRLVFSDSDVSAAFQRGTVITNFRGVQRRLREITSGGEADVSVRALHPGVFYIVGSRIQIIMNSLMKIKYSPPEAETFEQGIRRSSLKFVVDSNEVREKSEKMAGEIFSDF